MGEPKGGKSTSSSDATTGRETPRKRRRRRRTVFNLGMPFVQVDEFLDQAEDAVALGYKVLEKTIDEIKKGYSQAQVFNEKQRVFERAREEYETGDRKGPAPLPPEVPWQQVVESAQQLQSIAFETLREGSDILFDSMKTGSDSMMSVADVFVQSTKDVRAKPMAGPVFGDAIEVRAKPGEIPGDRSGKEVRDIRHRGLTRLRIRVIADKPVRRLTSSEAKQGTPPPAEVIERAFEDVTFEPLSETNDDVSRLTLRFAEIRQDQTPGVYESAIRASNFELIIAKVVIRVLDPGPRVRPVQKSS